MVKVTKTGQGTFSVPKGAVAAMKRQGFRVESEIKKGVKKVAKAVEEVIDEAVDVADGDDEKTETTETAEESESTDAETAAALKKKPIGQWTNAEVKEYAAIMGIDISGTKNPAAAKAKIKATFA